MRASDASGLSVELHANGARLPEYEDEEAADDYTRYVEAVPNTEFSIHVRAQSGSLYRLDDLLVGVRMDGQQMLGGYLRAREPYLVLSGDIENVNGVGRKRAWTFGELKTTDESIKNAEGPALKSILSELGEVTVTVKRVKIKGLNAPDANSNYKGESKIGDTVPEKILKGRAMSNRVLLKDAGSCDPICTAKVEFPYGHDPLLTFKFKYRSHRDLQIEGIIPRSPSPAPQESVVKTSPPRVKRERATTRVIDLCDDDDGDEDEVTVTSVGPVKKRQRLSNDSGVELVDLTND